MPPSDHPFHLWVARDTVSTTIAPQRIRVNGRANFRKQGNVSFLMLHKSSGSNASDRRLGWLIVLTAVGIAYACFSDEEPRWGMALIGVVGVFCLVPVVLSDAPDKAKTVKPSLQSLPSGTRVLTRFDERRVFDDLQTLADRIDKTLPALAGLVDSRDAASLVAQSLWQGAGILARKQEIRGVREDLAKHGHPGSPMTSRARLELQSQQARAGALWREVNEDLATLVSQLTVTAEAGEAFVRDKEIDDTLQRTADAINKLSLDISPIEANAGEQLADKTTAVLTAYRELSELYGGGTQS